MSRQRAIRRAAREAENAAASAARARRSARSARRRRLTAPVVRLGSSVRPRGRPGSRGPLAAKRQRTLGLMLLGFLLVQALTWVVTPDWGQRAAVLVASVFALPVLAVFVL